MLMLRYTLASAILAVAPMMERTVKPRWMREDNWKPVVKEAIFTAFARDLHGDHVELLRRAARQIEQSEDIQWDTPETPEEIERENVWLEPVNERLAEIDRKQRVRAAHFAKKNIYILTGDDQERIQNPDYTFGRLVKGKGVLSVLKYVPPEIIHQATDWGLVMDDTWVNTMIRHGIMTLVRTVDKTAHANYQYICTGPQYERVISMFGIEPDPHNGIQGPNIDYYRKVAWGKLPPRFPHPQATTYARIPKEWAEVLAKSQLGAP